MSEATSPKAGLTRRNFLKTAAAATGALGLAGAASMTTADGWLAPATATAAPEDKVAYTFHHGHCCITCALKCTVRDGRLVKVEPNDNVLHDRQRTICLKGISEIQHIYSEHRVQTPLRRVGARGTDEFEAIDWDTALNEIAEKLAAIRERDGEDAVLVANSSETSMNPQFLTKALKAQTRKNGCGIDNGLGNGFDPATGFGGGYCSATGENTDWVNSKLLLTVGSNYLESNLPNAHTFFDAKEAGCKTITVDPHFSTTAGKSDKWVPIVPGTDGALFLGMISHILENNLMDEEFVLQHSSLPFLVDEATGKLVRDHAEDPNAEEPETGDTNPFFVIGPDGKPAAYTAVEKPRLSGKVQHDGKTCCTVFDLLKKTQAPYTVDWASEVTGIPTEDIVEMAELYAEGPACLMLGWGGNDKMSNADIAGHAAAVLVALTGNIGKTGAHPGIFSAGSGLTKSFALGSWSLPEEYEGAVTELSTFEMRTTPNKVRALIAVGDHVAQHNANMNLTTQWIDTLELVVSIDPYFTEGAKYADYILPALTRFEAEDDYNNIAASMARIALQEKVLDPLFEAKSDLWIQRELLNRLGITGILPETSREYAEALLATSEDEGLRGVTLEKLAENQGVWNNESVFTPNNNFMDRVFYTTSTRMDVYYDTLTDFNQALPVWEENVEAYEGNPAREQFPFQLANVRSRFFIHNQFSDAKWIQEVHRRCIEVNPADIEGKDYQSGDMVEVYNDRGSYKTLLLANEAVRPGSARVIEGATSDFTGGGNVQCLTNDTTIERGEALMLGPVVPFSDTLVNIRKA